MPMESLVCRTAVPAALAGKFALLCERFKVSFMCVVRVMSLYRAQRSERLEWSRRLKTNSCQRGRAGRADLFARLQELVESTGITKLDKGWDRHSKHQQIYSSHEFQVTVTQKTSWLCSINILDHFSTSRIKRTPPSKDKRSLASAFVVETVAAPAYRFLQKARLVVECSGVAEPESIAAELEDCRV